MGKNIYIMISMSGTKFSRVLKAATRKKYTHVSISFNKEMTEVYSFGRKNQYLPFIAGFVKEDLKGGVYKKYNTTCEIYEVPVTDEEFASLEQEIENFKREYTMYKYNFVGLIFMAFDIPFERKRHYVCSQFVALILNKSGVESFNKNYTLVRPYDFYQIFGKQTIFSGILKQYKMGV